MRRKPTSHYVARAFLYLALIAGVIFFLFPVYWMVRTSLVAPKDIFQLPPAFLPQNPSFTNYEKSLAAFPFLSYFLNSVIVAAISVAGTVITSSMCAYSFSRLRWKGRDTIFLVVLSGIMVSFFVVMIPQFMMYNALGMVQTRWPLILPAWFGGGAFNIFLLRQFFMGIPRELDEAARIDGAGYARTYWQIILPVSKQALIVVGLLAFLASWNDFMQPIIFLSGNEKIYTLMLGLQKFISSYTAKWHYVMAVSTAVTIPSLILYAFLQRYFVEGITMTGIKA